MLERTLFAHYERDPTAFFLISKYTPLVIIMVRAMQTKRMPKRKTTTKKRKTTTKKRKTATKKNPWLAYVRKHRKAGEVYRDALKRLAKPYRAQRKK